ncbi:MAG: isoprenylcysteine carboxylmethyltransferase family protein, partial [Ignavibacteriaceae bacterium]|nr:isoprenylcysteine carboxylmethyltransferase family protein [Ignavibacteriaceae bacterium]
KILPPTYFAVCLIITVLLHYFLPIKQIINYPFNLLGFLFFLIGGVLNIWTDQLFKKNETTVKPDEKPSAFIQTGPFKISRNPMYLGMAILLIGIGFILGSITSFAGFVLFIITMEIAFIPQEDMNLQEKFGDEYLAYKKRIRRWI